MSAAAEQLIRELMYNVSASGNKVLERRLADLALWYYKNRQRLTRDNLAARQDFLEKAMWILLEVSALQLERIHELEHSKGHSLWIPSGMTVNGNLRQFK